MLFQLATGTRYFMAEKMMTGKAVEYFMALKTWKQSLQALDSGTSVKQEKKELQPIKTISG